MKKICLLWILVSSVLWVVANVHPALAAYSAHQNDQDINNFLTVYPFAHSTKLDDCSLCHPGGTRSEKPIMVAVIIAITLICFSRPTGQSL